MTERYILVSDDEYVYTLDTQSENYKTLEDFEKEEFENAKKDGVDLKEYEDAILESASDKYWDWVYNCHLEADDVNDILNCFYEENKKFKDMAISLIKAYQHMHDETDGLVLGDAMKERIYAMTDLLNNMGLHDLIKENEVEIND